MNACKASLCLTKPVETFASRLKDAARRQPNGIYRAPERASEVRACLLAIGCSVCELTGVYHEGEFNVSYAWLWMMIINNLSQIVSASPFRSIGSFRLDQGRKRKAFGSN